MNPTKCLICNLIVKCLSLHIKKHKIDILDYLETFPNSDIGRCKIPLEIQTEVVGKKEALRNYEKRKIYKRSSLEYYQCLYGNKLGMEKYKNRNKNASKTLNIIKPGSIKNLKKLYGDKLEENLKERGNIQRETKKINKTGTKEGFILKNGKVEGLKKYQQYIENCRVRHTKKGFISRHGKEEGLNRYHQFVDKSIQNLDSFIRRYGKEEGIKKYNNYIKKLKNNNYFCEGWWVKKYGIIDGSIKYRSFQTRDKDWWIEKYGENEGIKRYNEWIIKCTKNNNKISKESLVLFNNLNSVDYKLECQIGRFKVDFLYKNKIIEFYGTHWHADHRFYKKDDIIKPIGLSAVELWKRDKDRLDYLENRNYKVLVVWSYDFFNNQEEIISRCVKFLEG